MKGNFQHTKHALALIDSTKLATQEADTFAQGVAQQFHEIAKTEKMNAARAILVGIGLPLVKASLPRGQFVAWQKANVTNGNIWSESTARKNAHLYTRLAMVFLERCKPAKTELLALTAEGAILAKGTPDEDTAKLFRRIQQFCGEKSINQLLIDHGIRTAASSDEGSEQGTAEKLESIAADDNTLLADTAEWLLNLRKTVTTPETLKRFTASQIDQLERQLTDTIEDFRRAREAMLGA